MVEKSDILAMDNDEGKPQLVKVISPATLEGGSTFEAEVDGIKFMVTVPHGGIGEGDDFDVPYPNTATTTATAIPVQAVAAVAVSSTSSSAMLASDAVPLVDGIEFGGNRNENFSDGLHAAAAGDALKLDDDQTFKLDDGYWRHGFYDCFESLCCPCLLAFFCLPILMGQVMERMKFNFFGCRNESPSQPPICLVYTVITLGLFALGGIIMNISNGLGSVIWIVWGWYMLIVFTCARFTFRTKYNLPPTCVCGDSVLDDCCSVYWCGCCTAVQMARHTHDETVYPYDITTTTGLPHCAPEIV